MCAGADRDDLAQLAPQLQRPLPRRDGIAQPVGEVQLRRTWPRAGRRGWRRRRPRGAARSRRRRRPPGAPRSGRPRPPRRARTAGPGRRRPAAAAWWASTLGSAPIASSASIIAACSAGSEPGTVAPRIADRAISWRNATPRPCRSIRPVAASTPTVAVDTPSASSSSGPTGSGVQESSSRQWRTGGANPAVRASTASRTLAGIGASGWARIWLRKNGLPAVRRWTSAGSSPCPSTSAATADRLSGVSCSAARARRGDQVAEDRAQRMVDPHRVAVGQHQQQGQRRDPAGEEPHEVERRLVGPVQVLHHEHARAGTQGVEHRREDLVLGRGAAQQRGHRRAPARPRRRAAARAGGACSASRTCPTAVALRARSTKARSRTVLPMPASPATRTTEPWPAAARRARSSSTSRGCSRSSSRTPTIVRATTRAAQWADPRSHTGRGARTQGRTWVRSPVAVCEGVRAAELRP